MKRTISAEVGKGSVNHNSRKFRAENVDGNRTHLNIDYCNERTLHPAETSVTVCDDGDGIFDTAPTHRNIVTPSHIVTTALPLQALQCARSDCGCFHIGCHIHSAAVRR